MREAYYVYYTALMDKRVRTFRMWDDTWNLIEDRGRGTIATAFVNDMTEAGLGYARCYRCFTLVPAQFGDLAGKPLGEWVAEAGKKVTAQKCSAHEPVTIGDGAGRRVPDQPRAALAVSFLPGPAGDPDADGPDDMRRTRQAKR